MVKTIAKLLTAKGYRILGKNQKLVSHQQTGSIAEFDLIARDPQNNLTIVEIKYRLEDTKRVHRQLERYVGYLKIESPFVETVKRVIVISRPTTETLTAPWKKQGLEFFQFYGEKIIEPSTTAAH